MLEFLAQTRPRPKIGLLDARDLQSLYGKDLAMTDKRLLEQYFLMSQ